MNKLLALLLVIIFFFSCKKREENLRLDFTFDNMFKIAYSIKVDSNHVIFLKKGKKNSNYFKSTLDQEQLSQLEKFSKDIMTNDINSRYIENGEDFSYFQLFLLINGEKKTVFVYGREHPPCLDSMSNYLLFLKDNLNFKKIDTLIEFDSNANFYPSDPPPARK